MSDPTHEKNQLVPYRDTDGKIERLTRSSDSIDESSVVTIKPSKQFIQAQAKLLPNSHFDTLHDTTDHLNTGYSK